MNWDQISGKRTKLKGKVQEEWGKLQQCYGHAKEEAERELDEFAQSVR